MNIINRALGKARRIILRPHVVMRPGRELNVDSLELNKINNQYGDWFVHPCVRYISEGFAGHKWWMVVTPYPNYNSKMENPLLYYGNGNADVPPADWTLVGVVQDTHKEGYNADGNIFFDGNKLWIFWKESDTINTRKESGFKNMMGCCYDGKTFSKPRVFCHNPNDKSMYLAAPVVIKIGSKIQCLGVFSPIMNDIAKGKEYMFPRSIAVFSLSDNDLERGEFVFDKVVEQKYFKGCDFWHIDAFSYNGRYYCVETPINGEYVILGESVDGYSYNFFRKPLLHAHGYRPTPYLYKASGVVVGDKFYLFYPSKLKDGKRVHIFCSSMSMERLLKKI